MKLQEYLARGKQRVDEALERLLPARPGPAKTVVDAMRHALFAGGKRLRPIIAMAACEACGGESEEILAPACALEMIHTYSLIHDDLPAMDDDDLRRGLPTVHRAYGEAEAILAGDALHSLAFQLLAEHPSGDRHVDRRAHAALVLARGAGIDGMVGGQMADLEAERADFDADRVSWIHRHKTGALFAASAEIGAIHAGAAPPVRGALSRYGEALGLAFQIADDILDCTATAEALGKTPGKDLHTGKATFPALFGIEDSRLRADRLIEDALEALEPHGLDHEPLRALAGFAVARTQ